MTRTPYRRGEAARLLWAHFINFFVPETKADAALHRAWERCYEPLLGLIAAHPRARLTCNVDGSFIRRLVDAGLDEGVVALRRLAESGQVELTASAYGGPVLGPMNDEAIGGAVARGVEAAREAFGEVYAPVGFFPPEMSYDGNVGAAAARLGFGWMLLDEMSHSGKPGSVSWDRAYRLDAGPDAVGPGVKLLFRDRSLSQGMVYGSFDAPAALASAASAAPGRVYAFTGVEADIYGTRRVQPREFLAAMFEYDAWEMVTVSELLGRLGVVSPVTPSPASWSAWDTLAF